ncbi:hypothetical protein [Ruminobacter sp. RM87]|uniref:hypothetical protein n=1 Tax=Ruminobacter sp. RM87 TaxID=1200567 RepID=UPI0004E0E9AE|nr:hypothetical protein [Ruminobacter sp. RM87]
MISRKQLSKNLYKLTKKEFPEIFGEETNDDTPEVDSLGFPSTEEMVNYGKHGEDRANALDYEKAYIALIEQVKDKTHDEKVTFLMSHMDELRGMVDLFSYTDDDIEIKDDELLANLMLYRYENKISIIDDHDLELTKDYISETMAKISHRRAIEKIEAEERFKREHPEEYRQKREKERQIIDRLVEQMILEQPEFERSMEQWHKENDEDGE